LKEKDASGPQISIPGAPSKLDGKETKALKYTTPSSSFICHSGGGGGGSSGSVHA
jgi:hypothetical protein